MRIDYMMMLTLFVWSVIGGSGQDTKTIKNEMRASILDLFYWTKFPARVCITNSSICRCDKLSEITLNSGALETEKV